MKNKLVGTRQRKKEIAKIVQVAYNTRNKCSQTSKNLN